jgi:hypothetical protein
LIGPAFRLTRPPLTLSPGCSHLSSALRFDGQPLRKPLRARSRLPLVAAADRGINLTFDDPEPCLFNLFGSPSCFDRFGGVRK